jgi:hypothetical protein
MLHLPIIAAGKLIAAGAGAVQHALAAHALAAGAVGVGGGVATIAYLDHQQLMPWYSENPPSVNIAHSVKFAVGGKFISGEFVTVANNESPTAVLQGHMDSRNNEILNSRVIVPKELGPGLKRYLSTKGMVVFA